MAQGTTTKTRRSQNGSERTRHDRREDRDDRGDAGPDDSTDRRDTKGDGGGGGNQTVKSSHIIEEHIDVGVPLTTAFNQWTNYEEWPKWTKAETAKSKSPEKITFTSKIGPSKRTWQAEVVEQVPGRRIAWRGAGGPKTMGVVSFHSLDERLTRVMVEMEYHPSGFLESVGNFFRMQRRRVRKDLRLFKNLVELKGESEAGDGAQRVRGQGLRDDMDDRLREGDDAKSGEDDDAKG